ncbi:hypothetical protein BGZ83_000997, partial [Gryganskiella cystojenkinii]
VYCLNTALKLYDSVLVVPTFYGFYTAFGLVNSTIYLNQLGSYQPWVLLLVLVGICALIYGVKMLSSPKPEVNPTGEPLSALDNGYMDDEDEDAHEMEHRSKSGGGKKAFGDTIKGPKKSKLSVRLKKSMSNKRQSHAGAGTALDEENDVPSLYSSRRGMIDDMSSDVSSMAGGCGGSGESAVGTSIAGTSTRGRGLSFTSKSSFQSDPFRTPKDGRSIHEDYAGGLGGTSPASAVGSRRSMPFMNVPMMVQESDETPTHVLVDTTEELDGSDDEGHASRQQQQRRRESMLKDSLKNLTMHEKRASIGNQWSSQPYLLNSQPQQHSTSQQQQQQDGQLPRIDTTAGRTRRESARLSNSAGINIPVEHMSPSQLRAHLTNPKRHQQDDSIEAADRDGLDELVGFPSTSVSNQLTRGHSVRWSTGSSKIDQVFEDLNPFKSLGGGYQNGGGNQNTTSHRDSVVGGVFSAAAASVAASFSSSLPSSPSQPTSTSAAADRPSHVRQDSFSGLPSEWDVPGRKKRHSMRFGGDVVRSNSSSGGLVSTAAVVSAEQTTGSGSASLSSSSTPSPSLVPTATSPTTTTSTSTTTTTTSLKEGAIPTMSSSASFANGVMIEESAMVSPSPRTSRIMSSPEIQLSGFNFQPLSTSSTTTEQ